MTNTQHFGGKTLSLIICRGSDLLRLPPLDPGPPLGFSSDPWKSQRHAGELGTELIGGNKAKRGLGMVLLKNVVLSRYFYKEVTLIP